jgi:hypothetical protein
MTTVLGLSTEHRAAVVAIRVNPLPPTSGEEKRGHWKGRYRTRDNLGWVMKGPSAQYTGMIVHSGGHRSSVTGHRSRRGSLASHNDACEMKLVLLAAQLMEKWPKK